MTDQLEEIAGQPVLVCGADGPLLQSEGDALAIMGEALGQQAAWVLLPVARLHPDFFKLASGLAGGIAQKFVNYRVKLAVMGDIAPHLAKSAPLRDFVRETNKGPHLWFVESRADFERKLTP
jgi:hypothetical protein